jgi:hypothetical protein
LPGRATVRFSQKKMSLGVAISPKGPPRCSQRGRAAARRGWHVVPHRVISLPELPVRASQKKDVARCGDLAALPDAPIGGPRVAVRVPAHSRPPRARGRAAARLAMRQKARRGPSAAGRRVAAPGAVPTRRLVCGWAGAPPRLRQPSAPAPSAARGRRSGPSGGSNGRREGRFRPF